MNTFVVLVGDAPDDYRQKKVVETYNYLVSEKVVLYGKSYIKFLLEYACSELGVGFETVDVTDEIDELLEKGISERSTASFCLAGELSSQEVQDRLMMVGCVGLVELVNS